MWVILHYHYPIGHLSMSSGICDIFGCHNYWIKDRKVMRQPCNAQNNPNNEELWAPNSNSTEIEKPCLRGSAKHGC